LSFGFRHTSDSLPKKIVTAQPDFLRVNQELTLQAFDFRYKCLFPYFMKRSFKFITEYLTQRSRRRKERKEKQYELCVLGAFAFTTLGLIEHLA